MSNHSIEVQSFCFGCGKEINTEEERRDRHCPPCKSRFKASWVVFDDTIRSLEAIMNRASLASAMGSEKDD